MFLGGMPLFVATALSNLGFNPATLSLTAWWRGSYAGSPWAGTPSVGTSGSRSLAEATFPPAVGPAVNGFTPANFDGTNDRIGGTATLGDVVNNNAGSCWVLFKADTAAAPFGTGSTAQPFEQPGIVCTNGSGYWIVSYNSDGVIVATNDGSYKVIVLPASVGEWHLVQIRKTATHFEARIDGGSWTSVACGNIASLVHPIRMGCNYNATRFFDGQILDAAFSEQIFSDADFDDVKGYVETRYGLSTTAGPVVSSISNGVGDPAGGAAVTLTGSGFADATGATIGGVALTSFLVVNDTTITGITGAHALGVVDVVVTSPAGAGTLIGGFEYFNPSSLAKTVFMLDARAGVSTTGDRVDSWASQVDAVDPNKTVAAALDPVHRPKFTAAHAGYNNREAIETDGAGATQGLYVPGHWAATISQPYEMMLVGNTGPSTGADNQRMIDNFGVSPRAIIWTNPTAPHGWGIYSGAAIYSSVVPTAPAIVSGVYNGTSSAVYVTDHATPKVTGNALTYALNNICIGCFGGTGTGPNYFVLPGTVWACVLAFNAPLTTAERAKTFAWANSIWGVVWS